MTSAPGAPDFDLVLLGPDIGVFALARAFHEAYDTHSTVISRALTGSIDNCAYITPIVLPEDAEREQVVAALLDHGRRHSGERPLVLLYNADSLANMVTDHAEELAQYYRHVGLPRDLLDTISDKARFSEVCEELGIDTPRTHVQDFTGADEEGWAPTPTDIPFPLVAKPSAGSEYENLRFEGKKKIWFVHDQAELDALYDTLRRVGFRDRFLVQELIPGDDTGMRSVTAYVDQFGEVTLLATAQVLLEEHSPLALGNPCAMITTPYPDLMDDAARLLKHVGYRGFANLDVKVDPRDGSAKFLEMNPRIGRNNYYVTAAGANVARFVVADLVENRRLDPVRVNREILYSVIPLRLLRRYVTDTALAAKVRRLSRGAKHHPLLERGSSLKRRLYVLANQANHVKKFAQHYPKPTDSGF